MNNKKTYTIEDAKQWAIENETELNRSRLSCKDSDVQMFNRIAPEKSKELWNSGCWLQDVLLEHGATDKQVKEIQFAAGQRAFGGDAWEVSVDYVNEFISNGDTQEKPGIELAKKRHNELFSE